MGPPFLSFKALLPASVLADLEGRLEALGLDLSSPHIFDRHRWHQSISTPVESYPGLLERMLRAGDRIDATAFTLVFDHLVGRVANEGEIHWTLPARRPWPPAFKALVNDAARQLGLEGVPEPHGHSAHITISYEAPEALERQAFRPVAWPIDEIALVQRGGSHPGYQILQRWPLRPDAQLALW